MAWLGWLGAAAALVLIVVVFIDAFEAMMLPRRVRHGYRLARAYMGSTWILWLAVSQLFPAGPRRRGFQSVFGPLSLFGLMAMWAAGLIAGFALLHWSLRTALSASGSGEHDAMSYLYFSGTTFFTLGYGDLVPTGLGGRALSVVEAGIGFGFMAAVIGYLPVLYQAFSRREITISLLDARAGSPPSAGEMLRRWAQTRTPANAEPLLREWERWAAELLESHLSFPLLTYYRSQHDNQSWVGALTTILDTSALLIAGVEGPDDHQARLTFAMARHAAVDLALVFQLPMPAIESDRLSTADLDRLREWLRDSRLVICEGPGVANALAELRGLYEPFVRALALHFQFTLPAFIPERPAVDNWQSSPWMRRSPGLGGLPAADGEASHFD